MKKNILIVLLLAIVVVIVIGLIFNNKKENSDQNILQNEIKSDEFMNRIVSTDSNEINAIKNEINATGQTDIYQIEEEYDGRKIIQVKPDVQYQVALAGIIKNGIPAEDEINTILEQAPNSSGMWISESSREKFMELLNSNNIVDFEITNEGYLKCNKQENLTEQEEKLKDMAESDKLYVIDVSGKTYQRDYISGEVIEYPFEEMDPYQVLEPYEIENSIILGVTSNKENRLSNKEILDAIIAYV
ncbi:MAG: hypothetical protein ACLTME_03150 [Clostridia bacterium]|jgi:hypothetical protein|uniref:hypothetical protein n=1 Tax=Candidatus Merdicola sp. TaxID=3085652 RepID=UPI002FA4B56E